MFHAAPPYSQFIALPRSAALRSVALSPGTVLALSVAHDSPLLDASRDQESLARSWLQRLHESWPGAPVVLWFEVNNPAVVRLMLRTASLGWSGVVFDDEPLAPTLRRSLTQPSRLGERVVERLGWQGLRFSFRAAALIAQIIDRTSAHPQLGSLLQEMREPEAAARQYLRSRRLPEPRAWFCLGRALHAVLAIQRHSDVQLAALAFRIGYSDVASLSRQLHGVFGVRPSQLRDTLGWEWLLERWVRRIPGTARAAA